MITLDSLTPRRLKIALVAVPLALGLVYHLGLSADRYVSESVVTLHQSANEPQIPGAAMLLAGITPPARQDTLYLQEYVQSLDLAKALDAQLRLRAHWESPARDLLFRLWPGTSQEWFLDYYRSRVEARYDELTGLLTIRVQAFDPGFAQRVNRAILADSERFVNELSHQVAREKLDFVGSELKLAADRVQQARRQLLEFQGRTKLLDPEIEARATGELTAQMEASIARGETELRSLLSYLNEQTPQVRALRAQIEATRAQLEAERARATAANRKRDPLGAQAIEFQGLRLQADFAVDAYKLALAAAESARVDTLRKLKSLAVIQSPSLPEVAEYPRRLYDLGALLVVTLLLYAIARMVLATIREHQD